MWKHSRVVVIQVCWNYDSQVLGWATLRGSNFYIGIDREKSFKKFNPNTCTNRPGMLLLDGKHPQIVMIQWSLRVEWGHNGGSNFYTGKNWEKSFKMFFKTNIIWQYNHLVTKGALCLTYEYLKKILLIYTSIFCTTLSRILYDSIQLIVAQESNVAHVPLVVILILFIRILIIQCFVVK